MIVVAWFFNKTLIKRSKIEHLKTNTVKESIFRGIVFIEIHFSIVRFKTVKHLVDKQILGHRILLQNSVKLFATVIILILLKKKPPYLPLYFLVKTPFFLLYSQIFIWKLTKYWNSSWMYLYFILCLFIGVNNDQIPMFNDIHAIEHVHWYGHRIPSSPGFHCLYVGFFADHCCMKCLKEVSYIIVVQWTT